MVRRADRVIACSDYMRGHCASALPSRRQRITVIPNGIDPADLHRSPRICPRCARATPRPTSGSSSSSGGSSTRRASTSRSTRWPARSARYGDVRFVVAGTGTAEAELKKQARQLGLTKYGKFLGWVGDDMLHSLYRVSDVCLVPVDLRAVRAGRPGGDGFGCLCIVADTGGLREVVPGDGSVGLRFRSRDSDSLGAILEDVLADDGARAPRRGRRREHVLHFDWAEAAERRPAELYRGVVPAAGVSS